MQPARARWSAALGGLVCGLAALLSAAGPQAPSPSAASATSAVEALSRAFAAPPDDSRVMMRWWWFGPAVTKAGMARELRAMREAGIGGVEVQPVYPVTLDDETRGIRNLTFLSDDFLDALRFASTTARELGLRFDLTLGSGWPYGGPQVPVTQAAGRLRVVRTPLPPGTRQMALPDIGAGESMIAAFVARSRPANADAAAPRSATTNASTSAASSPATNASTSAAASPATDATTPATRDAATSRTAATDDAARELTDIADGMIRLPPDLVRERDAQGAAEAWELQVFIASRTGMMVKRPALGGEGFVLDHYDRRALDGYLATVGDRLMQAFAGGTPPDAIFTDSLEVFGSDWTPDFLAQFQRRRGYDLRPRLSSLLADDHADSAALRHDWGLTLTELLNEQFMTPMRDWAHRHDTKFRIQGYGMPPAALSSNARADLSDGEGTEWRLLSTSRWASSANHLYGRPVTASETWTWLHSPSFRATPLDMKAEADVHFLQGINQLIGHGWPYTADGADYPGWRFYAAAAFDEKNPWWIVMPDLSRYLQRVSFLLRQGRPANDVALYLPTADAYASFTPGNVHLVDILKKHLGADILPAILDAGFNLDFVDDEALRGGGKVEGGALVLGGNRYRAVILPGVERMPLDTLRLLDTFARGGGTVIATRRQPARVPGFLATAAEHGDVVRLAAGLFDGASASGAFAKDEQMTLTKLLRARLQPDVTLTPAAPDVGVVHRQTPHADIYFVANTSNQPRRVDAAFRVQGRPAELWDPMTGAIDAASMRPATRGARTTSPSSASTTVALDLPPYGSTFVVFSSRRLSSARPGPTPRDSRAPALSGASAASTASSSSLSASPSLSAAPSRVGAALADAARAGAGIDISGDWQVTFTSASDARTFVQTMARVHDWIEDAATRDFSGTAAYERRVDLPEALFAHDRAILLDFGEAKAIAPEPNARFRAWLDAPVREAVVVEVNGQRAGSLWSPPYVLDVTRWLRPGANQLRLIVGNLAINHMAARALPDYRLLNLRYGVRFEPQDMKALRPLPSGLLGPLTLRGVAASARETVRNSRGARAPGR